MSEVVTDDGVTSVDLVRRAAQRAESRMLIDGELVGAASGAQFDNLTSTTGLLLAHKSGARARQTSWRFVERVGYAVGVVIGMSPEDPGSRWMTNRVPGCKMKSCPLVQIVAVTGDPANIWFGPIVPETFTAMGWSAGQSGDGPRG